MGRSSQSKWLWMGIALVALPLIWLASDTDRELEPGEIAGVITPEARAAAAPEPAALKTGTAIAEIVENPADYVGCNDVRLEGVIASEVLSDHGFWIEDQGQRLFAIVVDSPRRAPLDISPGEQLAIAEGTIKNVISISEYLGEEIDLDLLHITNEHDVFLVVNEEDVDVLSETTEVRASTPRRANVRVA